MTDLAPLPVSRVLRDTGAMAGTPQPSDTLPFEALRLPLELLGDDGSLIEGGGWVLGGAAGLDQLVADLEDWIGDDGRVEPDELALATVLEPALSPLLARCGLARQPDGSFVARELPDRGEPELQARLRARAAPVHVRELAEGGDAQRAVERALTRAPWAWRVARGVFVHTDALPVSVAELGRIADLAWARVRGQPNAFSTRYLLAAVRKAGEPAPGVNEWLLKEVLRRRPDVRALRMTYVADAASFSEEGLRVADRVERLLREAGRALSAEEILARLPETLGVSLGFIVNVLHAGGFATPDAGGRWAWSG